MTLPATLTICTSLGSDASDQLCDAFLEAYGLILVSRTWYEITTVARAAERDGFWTWRLRLVREVGRA